MRVHRLEGTDPQKRTATAIGDERDVPAVRRGETGRGERRVFGRRHHEPHRHRTRRAASQHAERHAAKQERGGRRRGADPADSPPADVAFRRERRRPAVRLRHGGRHLRYGCKGQRDGRPRRGRLRRGLRCVQFTERGHEPVAVFVDRRDVLRAVGRVAEHFAEHGHVLRQAVFADVAVRPDAPHQLVLLDHAIRVRHEHLQQIEGFGREREDFVAAQQLPAAQVEMERAELVAVGCGGFVDRWNFL